MGNCLPKYFQTPEEYGEIMKSIGRIEERLKSIDRIEETLFLVEESLGRVEQELLCTKGDTKGLRYTVKVAIGEKRAVLGHGMVLHLNDNLYLLSAAHVLVEMMHCQYAASTFYVLQWGKDEKAQDPVEVETDIVLQSLYVSKDYIKSGICDIACAEIRCEKVAENLKGKEDKRFATDQLSLIEPKGVVNHGVVGHGLVLLKGRVIHSSLMTKRLMIDAPSVSGCSGCPVCSYDCGVYGLVHGENKHRCGHSNEKRKFGETSSIVYADALNGTEIHLVDEKFYSILFAAEDVPLEAEGANADVPINDLGILEDELSNLARVALLQTEPQDGEKEHAWKKMTLNQIMVQCCNEIWEGDSEKIVLGGKETFVYLTPRK